MDTFEDRFKGTKNPDSQENDRQLPDSQEENSHNPDSTENANINSNKSKARKAVRFKLET